MRTRHDEIPTRRLRATRVWRCVPSAFASTALESGPSFTKDRRYSVQGEFGAVYLSGSQTLSQLESFERAGDAAEPLSYLAFVLKADKLVDLTSRATRRHLGITLENLVKPRTAKDRYDVTQMIARRVYGARLNGIIAPSVHDPDGRKPDWFNVVLYPAHLLHVFLRPVEGTR